MLAIKLQEVAGNATQPAYIEDVFSTYLYTGNGSTQTITNGIDLSTKGGLVWTKNRSITGGHAWYDTARGASHVLFSNDPGGDYTPYNGVSAFTSTGFTHGSQGSNGSGESEVSWTFRKQPKFFDVVTYTGDGVSGRQIAHNLGSAPGCIIVKCTSTTTDWPVYHKDMTSNVYLNLPNVYAADNNKYVWGDNVNVIAPTSTVFTVGGASAGNFINGSGQTYVAYLFAHNAGGFGLTGTDNVISCGSFNVDGSGNATVDLGYEPQWVMIKTYEAAANWAVFDNMRGMPVGNTNVARLFPNTSDAESSSTDFNVSPTATGFTAKATGYAGSSNDGFIYITIRRGPMKTPTSGTSVFNALTYTGNATQGTLRTAGFPVDLVLSDSRTQGTNTVSYDRLRGSARRLATPQTDAEVSESGSTVGVYGFDSNVGYLAGQDQGAGSINFSGWTYVNWLFRRAPGFFDEVCYTGTGSATTQAHNLGVAPELMIFKNRTSATNWAVYHKGLGATQAIYLNGTGTPVTSSALFNDTAPTSSLINLGFSGTTNGGAANMVAYLFATCPGVSKCGSYTGTGTTQQINCGFTAGARFVLIKRTDSTGDWYVWDSARGIVTGNDPYLLLNSTAAEVTTTDYIDPYSAGFEISSTAPAAINASGGSFIYLAIA